MPDDAERTPAPIAHAAPDAGAAGDSEVVARLGVDRDPRYLYFVRETDVWRVLRTRDAPPERVAAIGAPVDHARHVYFLDREGNVTRAARRGPRDAAATDETRDARD